MLDENQASKPRSLRALRAADPTEHHAADLAAYEREAALARAAITAPQAFVDTLTPAMFEAPDYRAIWTAVQHLAPSCPDGIDIGSLHNEAARVDPYFVGPSGLNEVRAFFQDPPVSVPHALAVHVPEVFGRHKTKLWAGRFAIHAADAKASPNALGVYKSFVDEAQRMLEEPDAKPIGLPMHQLSFDPSELTRTDLVPTGFPVVDKLSGGGLGSGEMLVIGGGTNHGKSYAAQRILRQQAIGQRKVLYLSVEDSLELMECRMLADYATAPSLGPNDEGLPVQIRQRSVDHKLVETWRGAMEKEQGDRVYKVHTPKWRVSEITAAIRRHVFMKGVKLVIVDYIQAVQPDQPMNNRTQEVAACIAALKRCAYECRVALIVMSQYNRESYAEGAEPNINACKYAGDIENEAEILLLLWRDKDRVLHAKLPKIKWASAGNHRYLIPTDPVTGCFAVDWRDDFDLPDTNDKPNGYRKKTNGSSNGYTDRRSQS